jgi:hypothetical protein
MGSGAFCVEHPHMADAAMKHAVVMAHILVFFILSSRRINIANVLTENANRRVLARFGT